MSLPMRFEADRRGYAAKPHRLLTHEAAEGSLINSDPQWAALSGWTRSTGPGLPGDSIRGSEAQEVLSFVWREIAKR
jgi:hypothetical protein